jgi:hypothetical protein
MDTKMTEAHDESRRKSGLSKYLLLFSSKIFIVPPSSKTLKNRKKLIILPAVLHDSYLYFFALEKKKLRTFEKQSTEENS